MGRRRLEGSGSVQKAMALLGVFALSAFLLLGASPVSAGINQWTSNGPFGEDVRAIAIDPTTPTTLFAGTYGSGVFKSTNGGENWSQVNIGLTSANIMTIAIDPTASAILYAATSDQGVFKSTNGGESWSQVNSGLTSTDVRAIAIDKTSTTSLYVGTAANGLFKSTDGGGSWNPANSGLTTNDVRAIAIDPTSPATLYAGTSGGGLFKSLNAGGSWGPANTGLTSTIINALIIDPLSPSTLYAGTADGGVFKSTNGGGSWSQANYGLVIYAPGSPYMLIRNIQAFTIDSGTPATIYTGTADGGVFKSINGGGSWVPIITGLTNTNVRSLAVTVATPPTVYAGTNGGGVSGWTTTPVISIVPSQVDFGTINVGMMSSSQSLSIGNNGQSNLVISSFSMNGADSSMFDLNHGNGSDGTCGETPLIAPGGHCMISFSFTPGSAGFKNSNLEVHSNDITTPLASIPLRGTGGDNITNASPAGGMYSSSQSVAISAVRPATIYYTTDGTDPVTSLTRQNYAGPVTVSATTAFKFYGVDTTGYAEPVQTAVYAILGPSIQSFTFGGNAPWFVQNAVNHDGVDAHQNGAIGNSQSSWMETTVTGPGAVRFWWKVSSESCCDSLGFAIDGSYQTGIRGEVGWETKAYSIPTGTHALRWTYSTDSSALSGANAGWVDQVTFEQGSNIDVTPPTTTATPSAGPYASSQSVTLTCNDGDGSGCANTSYCFGDGCSPTTPYNRAITIVTPTVLRFYSTDFAGNKETVKTATYTFDSTPPTTTPNYASGTHAPMDVFLSCNDGSGSGCAATYSCLGAGCIPAVSGSFVHLSSSTDLRFYSVDNAGNSETIKTVSYTIDASPPTTTAIPNGGIFASPQSLTFSCSDGSGSGCFGINYCLGKNCSPATPYVGPIAIPTSTYVSFQSVDNTGNHEAIRTARFTILTTVPTTISVPSDKSTIQGAIDVANDGDTILVAPGTYVENIDFKGKAINVINSEGPDATIIDGNHTGTVVTFKSGEWITSMLSGFTIRNGKADGYYPSNEGGGVSVSAGSSPRITNNRIVNNTACEGAGIYIYSSAPVIQGNVISLNVKSGCSGGGGGGIHIWGESYAQILDNEISGNDAGSDDGGGISLFGNVPPTIRGNVIKNNKGSSGGGIQVYGPASIIQNVIANNTAYDGGGVYLWTAYDSVLVNNTIVDNNGTLGSAIYAGGYDQKPLLVNNIIVGKSGQNAMYCDNVNSVNSPHFSHNLVHTPTGNAYGGACTDQNGSNGNITAAPLFHGPTSGYYTLSPDSPGIDAGDGATPSLSATDLYGNPRIIDGNGDGAVGGDIGASEYDPTRPLATITGAPPGSVTTDSATLSIGGEGIVSYRYSVDGRSFSETDIPVTTPIVLTGLAEGSHTVAVIGKDSTLREQLVSYATEASWAMDTTPANVTAFPFAGTYPSSRSVTLTANEPVTIYYTTNGDDPVTSADRQTYAAPFIVSATTTVKFYGVDGAGNAGPVQTEVYAISEPSVLNFTTGGNAPWFTEGTVTHDGSATAHQSGAIGASETSWLETTVTGPGAVRFWWKLSPESYCSSLQFTIDGNYQANIYGDAGWHPRTFQVQAGSHTILWTYATACGVTSGAKPGWVDDITFTPGSGLDISPPTTAATPPGGIYGRSQSVSLSCSDGTGSGCSGTYYCLGSGCTPNIPYVAGTITIAAPTDLRFYSVDVAGNSEWVKTATYSFDTTAPATSVSLAAGTYSGSKNTSLYCNDYGSSYGSGCATTYYCLGSGCTPTTQSYGTPITISSSTDLRYYSTDRTGNSEGVKTTSYTITPDTSPPTTTPGYSSGTYDHLYFYLSCNDGNGSGCASTYYCLGSGCTPGTRYDYSFNISTSTDLRFYSQDKDGNSEAVKTVSYTIGSTPTSSKFVLILSTSGTTSRIGGVDMTVTLPAGVTVPADANGVVSSSALKPSGQWVVGSNSLARYTAATATVPATVRIAVVNAVGINAGEFARLTCDVVAGSFPNPSSFVVNAIQVCDMNGTLIPGVTAGLALSADAIAPALTISTLADKSVTGNTTLNVSGSVTDENGSQGLSINGVAVTINADGSFSHALTLNAGANTITTIAADTAGNQTVDIRTITLDQTAPLLTVTAPADNSKVNKTFIDVTGSVNETSNVDIKVNNMPAQTVSRSGAAFGASVSLAAGVNTIDIIATDLAGNTTAAKRTVTSDTGVPSLAVTEPGQDITTSQNSITITGTVADALTAVIVAVIADGQTYAPQVVNGGFTQTITLNSAKTYVVTVTATDEVGNRTTVQRNIIYVRPAFCDLNGDGKVDIGDAIKALRIGVGIIPLSDGDLVNGDVAPLGNDGRPAPDGKIDLSDAMVILKRVVGLISW